MLVRSKASWALLAITFAALGAVSGHTSAQDATLETQYKKRLTESRTVTPFREFGDQVNLRDGTMTFKNTDIALEGTGPTIKVVRAAQVHDNQINRLPTLNNMGAWMLEVPRIKTVTANGSNFLRQPMDATSPVGWQIGTVPDKNARCTHFSTPGDVTFGPTAPVDFLDVNWFFGYTLVDADGNEHVLGRRSSQLPSPGYNVGTNDGWVVSCLAQTANGEPGEAFLAVAPDGTKYWFNYLSYTDIPGYAEAFEGVPPKDLTLVFTLYRRAAAMLVTRIEDRDGNYLTYSYNAGRLTSIASSDGRRVDVTHGNSITSITTGTGRTWNYGYTDGTQTQLASVTQPDGSTWTYAGDFSGNLFAPKYYTAGCTPPNFPGNVVDRTLTVKSPSGATASFGLGKHIFGRSYLQNVCTNQGVQLNPNRYVSLAILTKTVTGPSVNEVWQYQYSSHNASYTSECASGCPTEVYTDEIAPTGVRTRSVFSNKYDRLENALVRTEIFSPSGTLVRRVSNSYALWGGGASWPWPEQYILPMQNVSNYQAITQIRPLLAQTVEEGGVSYVRAVNTFDVFGRALSTTLGNPWRSRTDVTTLYDDQGRWILGQVARVDNTDTGKEVSRTTFDAQSRPYQTYSFGQLTNSFTYNSDGTLATATNANNVTTTFTDWKRGLPRRIDNPGSYVRLEVDDNGWISSVRDEAGFTTSYNYDLMGRMTQIVYPAGDSVAWEPTHMWFSPLTSGNARPPGIVDGQWAQTVSQGNYRKLTYYDALWRPVLVNTYDNANPSGTMSAVRYMYDGSGRLWFASYPSSSATGGASGIWTEYDAVGRTTSVSQDSEVSPNPLLTTIAEYLPGSSVRVTDALGRATVTNYQAFDTPSTKDPLQIQQPEGAITDITRDVFGRPTSIRRHNGDNSLSVLRSYVYDTYGRLCKQIEPETGATAFGYDNVGNLIWSVAGLQLLDAANCDSSAAYGSVTERVDRTYDLRNRLKTLAFYSRNGNQTWDYTLDGLPSQITTENNQGSTRTVNQYTYNGRRLLTGESATQEGSFTWSMTYGYDALGSLASLNYPSGTLSVDYAPNALGQPTKAGTYATGVTYYPNGAMASFTYGNGIAHSMTQNARQLPGLVTESDGVMSNSYSYDRAGNVTQIVDGIEAARTRSMEYDGLSRLTKATSTSFGAGGVFNFTYDALDNIRSAKFAGGPNSPTDDIVYYYDGYNRLANTYNSDSNMTASLLYDARGNVVNKNGRLFEFDTGNRLRKATNVEEYRYDGYGRRVLSWSASGAGNIWSMYSQDGTLRRQNNDREAKIYEYVSLNGSLIARVVTTTASPAPTLTGPATSLSGSFTLQWNAVAAATSYKLEQSVNGGAYGVVQNTSALSWSASGLPVGTYGYRVSGCQGTCGALSAVLVVTVQVAPTPPATAPAIAVQPTPRAPNGMFTVTWTVVPGATGHVLEENLNNGAFAVVPGTTGTSNAFSAKPAGHYGYRIRAINDVGAGPYSSVVYTDAVYAPPVPALGITGNGFGAYTVSWNTVPDATSYRLEEAANGGAWNPITTSGYSYAVTGRSNGYYTYRVQACNEVGCSAFSAVAGATVLWPPAAPGTPSVPSTSSTGAYTISWGGVPTAVTYQLEESLNGGGWSRIHDEGATQRSVSGRGEGVYRYRVQAWNASGYSAFSGEAAITVAFPPPTPAMPNALTCVSDIDDSTTRPVKQTDCSWTTVSGATSYQLGKDTTGTNLWYQGPNTYFSVLGNTVKTFYVRACNAVGCSAWKGPVTE